MLDRAKHLVPAPIRALRWRLPWMRLAPAYAQAPLDCWRRAIGFTLREVAGGEFGFRTPDGLAMRTMPNNFSSFAMAVAGARDPDIWRFVAARLRPGMVFVDAGANIGAYTLPAAKLVAPGGRVIAFEAHPLTFGLLKGNVEANGIANATVVNEALGEEPGRLRLSFTTANPGETHIAAGDETGAEVPVTPLDAALEARGVGAVDYLKIDVEGFELPVLRGARATIRRSPTIVVQTELQERHAERYGHSIGAIADLLRGEGLAPFIVAQDGTLEPVRGTVRGDILWTRPA
jgi:FkbM family methyltransferase